MKKFFSSFFFFKLIILLFCFFSCSPTKKITDPNVSYLYKKEINPLHPNYTVYHISDTVSELHFKINSNEIKYKKSANENNFVAKIMVIYKLLNDYESNWLIDSATIVISDTSHQIENKNLYGKTEFKAAWGRNYIMEILMTDLHQQVQHKSFLTIEKNTINNRQNYLVTPANSAVPLFRNYIYKEEKIKIICPTKTKTEKLFVRYYHRKFPIAAPPFLLLDKKPFNYAADSTFEVLTKNNIVEIYLNKNGFYHFQTDTSLNKDGLSLFYFDTHFPEIETAEDLVPPLRYISTKQEFEEMNNAENKKEAVDKFWLNNAGNTDVGREMIRKFYNRVQETNYFFTSYLEGWKTDRGLIYLIFGPPTSVFKYSNSENWVYGEENSLLAINFNFIKVINPFSDNDFSLDRSPNLKNSWYRTVDAWRTGRIY